MQKKFARTLEAGLFSRLGLRCDGGTRAAIRGGLEQHLTESAITLAFDNVNPTSSHNGNNKSLSIPCFRLISNR